MINNSVSFLVGDETLAGTILRNSIHDDTQPRCVFLHGGSTDASKESVLCFANPMIDRNVTILSFDMSRHGQSIGEFKKSSLKKRVTQARKDYTISISYINVHA